MKARSEWTRAAVAGVATQSGAALPLLPQGVTAPFAGMDLWDMWPIAHRDGSTVRHGGRSWWFFLAAPRLADPEGRHDLARIRLTSHGEDGWRDHGDAFPDGFTPGSREWSGSAILEDEDGTLAQYFTAAGRRGEAAPTYAQRLFVSRGSFRVDGDTPVLGGWSTPEEIIVADGAWYTVADETVAPPHGIQGFRDPGYFRDPADGAEYVLFTANAAWSDVRVNGVIGMARRDKGAWRLQAPLVAAIGVNSELERPHIVVRDRHYFCFWSTQGRRFAEGIAAPTGLYAMVADSMAGPWRPVNGTGLVAGNPAEAPTQAYCWWVTGEGEVLSFVDYPGVGAAAAERLANPSERRRIFGGIPAPSFRLAFEGERVTLAP